jgi:hypothetical protein
VGLSPRLLCLGERYLSTTYEQASQVKTGTKYTQAIFEWKMR